MSALYRLMTISDVAPTKAISRALAQIHDDLWNERAELVKALEDLIKGSWSNLSHGPIVPNKSTVLAAMEVLNKVMKS